MQKAIWLELSNIDVIQKEKYVLKDINLKLYLGEVITILGPNGSGKSSLINLINRNLYPLVNSNSKIKLFNKELINIWDLKQKISCVNEDLNKRINHRLTTKEVIISGLYGTIGMNKNNIIKDRDLKLVDNILNEFSLTNISNEKYQDLSDGQKRNVILARAMVNKPEVLILDEPTINLDMKSLFNLFNTIKRLLLSKITIIYITNKIDSILKETDRIVLMKNGRIIADGHPRQIMKTETINNLYETNIELININGNWRVIPK